MAIRDAVARSLSAIKENGNHSCALITSLTFHGGVIGAIVVSGAFMLETPELCVERPVIFEQDGQEIGEEALQKQQKKRARRQRQQKLQASQTRHSWPKAENLDKGNLEETRDPRATLCSRKDDEVYDAETPVIVVPARSLTESLLQPHEGTQKSPEYPENCRVRGITGTLQFRLRVDMQGHVRKVHCLSDQAHISLRQAAETALETWQFTTFKTPYDVFVPVTFALEEE